MRKSIPILAGVVFALLLCLTALASEGLAQSAFTGVIKDETGAVLPGVSIEASSPVLIEKTRSVISDERGSYRVVDLRPGTYTLEFSLPGFSAVKREIELQSNFTATINVEMKVGAAAESVTVSADRLLVTDVENNQKVQVLPREVLDSVPTAHTIQSVGQLITGVTLSAPDVAGSRAMQQTYFSVHGAGAAQTTVLMDGMIINGLQGDGAIQSYGNDAGNQEMVYQTGGGTVDSPTGGLKISMVPKEGGNEFHGSLFAGFEGSRLQSDNLSPFLASHGVKAVDKIGKYRDINATLGGRIIRDKLWFFTSMRLFTVHSPVANTFYVPQGQTYANCLSGSISCTQGVNKETINSGLLRLTWQVTSRNKLSAYIDRLFKTRDRAMSPGDDPETASVVWGSPLYMTNTIKWTSTVTNRLLIQAGYSSNIERYTNQYQPGIEKKWGTPEWYAGASKVDTILGTRWNAGPIEFFSYPDRYNVQGSASYVTGPHNMKFGFQNSWGPYNQAAYANADLYQNYQNGAPFQVTLRTSPIRWQDRLNTNLGVFAQDAWTIKRATISYGMRWEYVREQVTGQPAQAGRFSKVPAYDTFRLPIWRTWSPRISIVYDLFGNTKTAVRAGYNKFAAAATTTFAGLYNPGNAILNTATAAWVDVNKDDIAQGELGCDFGTSGQLGCEINFANVPKNFGVISLASPDRKLKRPYFDSYNVGFTHEILKGMAVSGEWFHNEGKNIVVRNNVLRPGTFTAPDTVVNSNYRAVTVFSPIDGKAITMYDPISATVQQAVANVDTNEPRLKQKYNSFEFNFNARLRNGVNLFGGSATERTVANVCASAVTNPNILNYCDQSKSGIPWRTQFKLAGTYPLPFWGIQLSGALQALPGYILGTQALTQGGAGAPNLTAVNGQGTILQVARNQTYTVCPGDSAAAGCKVGDVIVPGMTQSSINVPLVAPGTELTPRITQVDFSVGKRFAFERIRVSPKIDIFNAFNSSAYYSVITTGGLNYSTAAGSAYMRPQDILRGRILRLAVNIDF
jgi:hypothetical protein